MDYPRLLQDGGGSLPVQRVGWTRWSVVWIAAGLSVSFVLHGVLYAALGAIPWDAYVDHHEEVSWTDPRFLPGAQHFAGVACFAGIGFLAWWWQARWPQRLNGWAMASAVANLAAMWLGWIGLHELAVAGVPFGPSARNLGVLLCLACFALAFVFGLAATVTLVRDKGRTTGWILALWGLTMPLWLGGFTAHEFVFPIFRGGPSEAIANLPEVAWATTNRPDPEVVRPTLVIDIEGNVSAKGTRLLDAERLDDTTFLEQYLATKAKQMVQEHLDVVNGTGPLVPDDPLLVLPDASAEFSHVTRILRLCGLRDIGIWKIELGVRRTNRRGLALYVLYLAKHQQLHAETEAREPNPDPWLTVEVVHPGTKLDPDEPGEWSGEGRFRFGGDRVLRYSWGGFQTTDLAEFVASEQVRRIDYRLADVRPGVTWGDLAHVLEALTGQSRGDRVFDWDLPPR